MNFFARHLNLSLGNLAAKFVLGYALIAFADVSIADDAKVVQSFLSQNCYKCHGAEKQNADRRVDDLTFQFDDEDQLGHWQDILDQLNIGDMPPASQPKPDANKLKRVIAILTASIEAGHRISQSQKTETVLRRLNNREYSNTIRDIFGFDMTMFDPTIGFPEDAIAHGLDNQGNSLVTSSYLLENYLKAAEKIIEKAIVFDKQPSREIIKMSPPFDRTTNEHSGWVTQERRNTKEFQSIFQGTKERFGYRPLDDIRGGVKRDGWYKVRIKACGLYRKHDYPEELIGTDTDEPIKLALVSGSHDFGTLHLRQSIEKTLAVYELPDDQPEWIEKTIWLDKGFQPRMTYQNGTFFFKGLPNVLHRKFPKQFPVKLKYSNWWEVCQTIKTPQIRVHNVEIEGPIYQQWPPASHEAIFGDKPFDETQVKDYASRFATKAFRRPANANELRSILDLIDKRQQEGDSPLDALKAGLTSILCSPGFLYLEDSTDSKSENLDDWAIASRLSYFLWSTCPDDELLALAKKGKLTDPQTIRSQTKRMLKDGRASGLVADFADRWLTLYKLGEMPPDSQTFKHYYVGELESAMRTETHLFFKHILENNLDIANFLDADFTFVNRPLVRHYKYDASQYDTLAGNHSSVATDNATRRTKNESSEESTDGFVKMPVNDKQRGGLLGHASVLTVTANGIDTSPVIRGVWVLENILGAGTPPPPEGIEPLEPDTRGAASIREQLKKHRHVESCAQCHQKIDPLGFALESFDAVGGKRLRYKSSKKKVDTSGKLPSCEQFENIAVLKKILLSRKSQFAQCLTEKMLSYSIGRGLTIRDRPAVDQIVEASKSNPGLEDLILQIVTSDPFRKP